jgi:hypothetical protein
MRGIVICVDYDDLLRMTLPLNMKYMEECVVVTSLTDTKTADLVSYFPSVKLHRTDAFTRYGARFNKGLAMEEGLDLLGRDGWIIIWDADIVFPPAMNLPQLDPVKLYGPSRLILNNPVDFSQGNPDRAWRYAKSTHDREFPGFFQLFNASSPYLRDQPYWYDPTFRHAGGGDSYFQNLWPPHERKRMPFTVLHLGPRDSNWYGRVTDRLDSEPIPEAEERNKVLKSMHVVNGWLRDGTQPDHYESDRVAVPGYVSNYRWHKSVPPENQG